MTLSLSERDRRYRAVRAMMEEKELSVLVAASNAMWTGNVRYFSNFFPAYGYFYLIFPKEGEATQYVGAANSALVAQREGWVKDTRTAPNVAEALVKRMRELGAAENGVGLMGVENIAFRIYEHLKKEFPSARFVDVTQDIFNMRMVKSDEEIAIVRNCARLNTQLLGEVKKVAKVGANERDVYAQINDAVWKAGVEHMFQLIASGPFPVSARIWPHNRTLAREDSVFLELTPRLDGYYTQICVTHPVAEPSARMKEFLDVAAAALDAGAKLMKPGNCAGDVARTMQETIEKAGYTMPFRPGHSMGHELDEPPGIVAGNGTVFKPGMTIVLHPSMMDANGDGVFVGDSYLLTETGWERLTTNTGI